jgi:peptide-methionine (S)-S-oxide reductase
MFFMTRKKTQMVAPEDALPGRAQPIPTAETHFLSGRPLDADVPEGMEEAMFGMGCFWGVERMFWSLDGVWLTMVGYAGGFTPNPTYQEVCSGQTGHNEVVRVIYDPSRIGYDDLLRVFWEGHNPTQGMRQGNDVGTQYRSGIYAYTDAQKTAADASKAAFAPKLVDAGYGVVTTEIIDAPAFYFAEDYHQQYLAKNPGGYCGIGGTGVTCPIGTGVGSAAQA